MGAISFLMGADKSKSQSTQESSNRAFDLLSPVFQPMLGYANEGASGLSRLLNGDFSGFNTFRNGTGFDFAMNRGMGAIDSNAAARRMVHSGSALKSLQEFGSGLTSQYADKYIQSLIGLSGIGSNAASALTGAGNVSKMQSTAESKKGKGLLSALKGIGSLAAGVPM